MKAMQTLDPNQTARSTGAFRPVAPGSAPVFACRQDGRTVFYAPRLACVVPAEFASETESRVGELLRDRPSSEPCASAAGQIPMQAAKLIVAAARCAEAQAAAFVREGFNPECLTLFLNNACNLKCRYCHAAPGSVPDRPISDRALRAAAGLAAGSCARRGRPLTVAFHGGGEPSLAEGDIDRFLNIAREETRRSGTGLRTYIATNGAMPESRARWLAARFDLVGLSCDGPPAVQDRQRPARDGSPTSSLVERTGAILRETGTAHLVRATITSQTLGLQASIVDYFLNRFAPTEVRLEPIYASGTDPAPLNGNDAPAFVAGFMEARRAAAARRIPVTSSLALPGSLHGRYCNVLRQVLNLAPGDVATGCFLESRADAIDRRHVRIGALRPETGRFEVDHPLVASMLARGSEIPSVCRGCLCAFQCSHGCPDTCAWDTPFTPEREAELQSGFRCRASRLLVETLIREAAETAWLTAPDGGNQDVWDPARNLRVVVCRDASTREARP